MPSGCSTAARRPRSPIYRNVVVDDTALAAVAALVLFLVVLFGANAWVFQAEQFSWFDFVSNYLLIPIFVLLYLGHKFVNKTKVVPLKDCNFEMDEKV